MQEICGERPPTKGVGEPDGQTEETGGDRLGIANGIGKTLSYSNNDLAQDDDDK